MKKGCLILTAFLAVAASLPAYASGRVWSEVKDNVAYVHHDDAWWNCCPDTVFEIVPHPDSSWIIDIYEHDLDTHPCDCLCYFNFTHTLRGLAPGTYLARVWETCGDSDFELAGTTTFSILAEIGSFLTGTEMSECHFEPEGVEESENDRGLELENVSSGPAQKSVGIRYHLPAAGDVNLEIYDVTGTRVRILDVGQQGAGDHIAVWDICDNDARPVPRGIYFVRLEARGQARSLPLIVLR